ncbi:MAG: hypothetical protein JSU83_03990 [Deltaproteobacteria bacterium]|nr:MAG: hypothetical protein JSU83_03990 [Deltaproteobacteria bacterium]
MPARYARKRIQSEPNVLRTIKTKIEPLTVFFSFLLLLTTSSPLLFFAADKYQTMINCDLHSSSCTQKLPGCTVNVEVNPKPIKAMKDLLFSVTLLGKCSENLTAPYIDLGMPGMHMGPNRVILKSVAPGIYEGRGIIVRCPSGKRIWQATIVIPDIDRAEFIFDVIY